MVKEICPPPFCNSLLSDKNSNRPYLYLSVQSSSSCPSSTSTISISIVLYMLPALVWMQFTTSLRLRFTMLPCLSRLRDSPYIFLLIFYDKVIICPIACQCGYCFSIPPPFEGEKRNPFPFSMATSVLC